MPTTTSEVATPASAQEFAQELAKLTEMLAEELYRLEEAIVPLKADETIEADSPRRWVVTGFTQEAELYLTLMLRSVLELRTHVNGGTEHRDVELMDALGAEH